MALDIAAISAYCDHYEIPVERDIFNDCIFAMDNIFLDDSHKKMKRPTKITLEVFTKNNSRVIIDSSS
ncbi:hypothetical protein DIQ19_07210 [Acinetobacter baumannii]|nr:hypothetical protein [Acinetobacter baumannii]